MKRHYATIAALIVSFLVGVPSALSIDVLQNQVSLWRAASLICYPHYPEKLMLFFFWVGFCLGVRIDDIWLVLLCACHSLQPCQVPTPDCQ